MRIYKTHMYVEFDQVDERIWKKTHIPVETGMWVLLRPRQSDCPSSGFSREGHESQPESAFKAYFVAPSVANLANALLSDSSAIGE